MPRHRGTRGRWEMALTRRARRLVITTTVVAGVITAAAVTIRIAADRLVLTEACTATALGTTVRVSPEQAEHAATIAAVAVGRDLPARATTIALATTLQESGLRNLDHGDRDSLGLFQQRPSQGWGTPEQVMDPIHAAGAFYDALTRIDYRRMDIGAAAQAVQRSGFPKAYDKHEPRARALASALTGHSSAAFTCAYRARSASPPPELDPAARVSAAVSALRSAFGTQEVELAPTSMPAGEAAVRLRRSSGDRTKAAWSTAAWLVGHAQRLGLSRIELDGHVWQAARSIRGWQREDHSDLAQTLETITAGYVHFEVR